MVISLFVLLLLDLVKANNIFGFTTKTAVVISASNAVEINGVTMRQDFKWLRNIGL